MALTLFDLRVERNPWERDAAEDARTAEEWAVERQRPPSKAEEVPRVVNCSGVTFPPTAKPGKDKKAGGAGDDGSEGGEGGGKRDGSADAAADGDGDGEGDGHGSGDREKEVDPVEQVIERLEEAEAESGTATAGPEVARRLVLTNAKIDGRGMFRILLCAHRNTVLDQRWSGVELAAGGKWTACASLLKALPPLAERTEGVLCLRALDLSNAALKPPQLAKLTQGLQRFQVCALRQLRLDENGVGASGMTHLAAWLEQRATAHANTLELLSLQNCMATSMGTDMSGLERLMTVACSLPVVRRLDLSQNVLEGPGLRTVAEALFAMDMEAHTEPGATTIPEAPGALRELVLDHNLIPTDDEEVCVMLGTVAKTLRYLSLASCRLGDAGTRAFVSGFHGNFPHLPAPSVAPIPGAAAAAHGEPAVADVADAPEAKEHAGDDDKDKGTNDKEHVRFAAQAAEPAHCTQPYAFNLAYNGIRDFCAVGNLLWPTAFGVRVTSLRLKGNPIGGEYFVTFTNAVARAGYLENLDLTNCGISPDAMVALATALLRAWRRPNGGNRGDNASNDAVRPPIHRLNLQRNGLGFRGATALAQLLRATPHHPVRYLGLSGTRVGERGALELFRFLAADRKLVWMDLKATDVAVDPDGPNVPLFQLPRSVILYQEKCPAECIYALVLSLRQKAKRTGHAVLDRLPVGVLQTIAEYLRTTVFRTLSIEGVNGDDSDPEDMDALVQDAEERMRQLAAEAEEAVAIAAAVAVANAADR